MASMSGPFNHVTAVEAQPPDHQFVGRRRLHQHTNSLHLRRRKRRHRTAFTAMPCQRTRHTMAMRTTRRVRGFETGRLGVVAHSFSTGKIHRALEIEWFAVDVRAATTGAWQPCAILLESQRCDITAQRIPQTLAIVLSAPVFRSHLKRLRQVTKSLVGIKVNCHRRNVEACRVGAVDQSRTGGKHLSAARGSTVRCSGRQTDNQRNTNPLIPMVPVVAGSRCPTTELTTLSPR